MRPLPVTDVAAMKTYEPDDHVISIYTRISNRAEYGAPLQAPTVDVPASWDYPDEPTEPLRRATIAPGLHRRRKGAWPVVVSYAVSAGVWVALGALIGARL